jgi:plastocyanin domain-containing protein
MDTAQIIVTIAGLALIALILWFFFGPRRATAAALGSGVQEVNVVVEGGYSPDRIELRQGTPVRLKFMRQESNPCTEQVVLPDFGIVRDLPQGQSTSIEFTPDKAGEYPFHCAMNMVRGQLIVKPAASSTSRKNA